MYPLPHTGQCAEAMLATSPGVRSSVTRQMCSSERGLVNCSGRLHKGALLLLADIRSIP